MNHPTVKYQPGAVLLLDQTRLPAEVVDLECSDIASLIDAIRRLVVRGAPAIGVAAAHGVTLAADLELATGKTLAEMASGIEASIEQLRAARPTAVNLGWALDRMRSAMGRAMGGGGIDPQVLRDALAREADQIHREDVELCAAIGKHGAQLLPDRGRVMTHCNAGALATAGIGTALGVIYAAVDAGKRLEVFVDETRPLLQGARLTLWELGQHGVPATLICDGAAGSVLRKGPIDAVITGADRIAANGDVANKIGTYPLAVLAHRHGVPFYVAAPYSTLDLSLPNGDAIPIEERDPAEVSSCLGQPLAPPDARAYNPAFDITPAELVAGIITERGVFHPPYASMFAEAYSAKG